MNLGLIVTARCNASCTHCSTSCGPHETASLETAEMLRWIEQWAALPHEEGPGYLFSGGEPFLDYPKLLAAVTHAAGFGTYISCVTNGYWASTEERALRLIGTLASAGLTNLAVSTSIWHQKFVSLKRVGRVLGAARQLGLPCSVKYARGTEDPTCPSEFEQWAAEHGATSVQILPLMPTMRTGTPADDSRHVRERGIPEGPCPSAVFSVRETGDVFACCAPGAFNRMLSLGNLRLETLGEIYRRQRTDPVLDILMTEGPAVLAKAVMDAGEGNRLRDSYANVCELCTHICNDPWMSKLARSAATSRCAGKLSAIFTRAIARTSSESVISSPSSPE